MALQVTLRQGDSSSNDIALTSGGIIVTGYPLQTPALRQEQLNNLGDGNSLTIPAWNNVTESIDLLIVGASAAAVQTTIRSIEKLLDLARQGTTGILDDRVYLLVQFDSDSEAWRSQILAARLEYDQVTDDLWRGKVRATLIIERRYYWETASLHEVEATSAVDAVATTDFVGFENDDDSGTQNWVSVAADQVTGSIPAPAKITIRNASGASRAIGSVYIGNYTWNNPGVVDPIMRGEQATGGDSTPGTSETNVAYWSLSSALISAFNGQFGRLIVVFSDRPASDTLLRGALEYRFPTPVIDLALGEQFIASGVDFVEDLGGLPIPPGGISGSVSGLYVAVRAQAASGTDTVGVDWLQIMPSGAGRFRKIKGITNFSMASGETLVDDGPNDAVYNIAAGLVQPIFRGLHSPIHLWPGRTNQLRIIISGGTTMEPGQIWEAKIEYRPRRLTV